MLARAVLSLTVDARAPWSVKCSVVSAVSSAGGSGSAMMAAIVSGPPDGEPLTCDVSALSGAAHELDVAVRRGLAQHAHASRVELVLDLVVGLDLGAHADRVAVGHAADPDARQALGHRVGLA